MILRKMKIRDQIINDIVNMEFNNMNQEEFETLGYDYEKFSTEGSCWILYVWDCMADYYKKNKPRIDKEVNEILEDNKI